MSAEMLAKKRFPLYIPAELIAVIGEITIRFGQLERLLIYVLAKTQSESQTNLYDQIENFKGLWINELIKKIKQQKLLWINISTLEDLQKKRNGIMHDAVMLEENGTYTWQASDKGNKGSGRRKHEAINIAELIKLRNEVTEFLFSLLEISERQN